MMSSQHVTIRDFERWLRENTILKESSIRQYVSQIEAHRPELDMAINGNNVEALNRILISEFRSKNSNTKKPAIVQYLRFRGKGHFIPRLVRLKSKPRKHMPNWFSPEQVRGFLETLDPQTRLILQVQYEAGTRIREVLTLRKRNVQVSEGTGQIMVHTKGGRARIKDISADAARALLNIEPEHEDYLFLKPGNAATQDTETMIRSRYNRVQEEFRERSRQYFGTTANTHDLRRSIAEQMIKRDPSIQGIRRAQKYLDHNNARTTFAYFHSLGVLEDSAD